MPGPNNTHTITAKGILSLSIRTNSRNPVVFRVYDTKDGLPLLINGGTFISLYPAESLASAPQRLLIRGEFNLQKILSSIDILE